MRPIFISLCLMAGVAKALSATNDTQELASKEIQDLQKQANDYLESTVKLRHEGCTPENIVYRQEW
jgi:hypothetical protein